MLETAGGVVFPHVPWNLWMTTESSPGLQEMQVMRACLMGASVICVAASQCLISHMLRI